MTAAEAMAMRSLAAEAAAHLVTDPLEWNPRLAPHHEELSQALRWFIESGDAESAVNMAADLRRYWFDGRHHAEARDLSAAAIGIPGAPTVPRYAEAAVSCARFTFFTGRSAADAYALALEASRASGDIGSEVESLAGLARVALREGRFGDVRSRALEAAALARTSGNPSLVRIPVHMLAAAARMTGNYDEARRRYAESIAIGEAIGMLSNTPNEQHNLGYVELHSGDVAAAEQMFRLAIEGAQRTGAGDLLPYCVLDFGILAVAQGDLERGAILVAAAKAAFDAAGVALDPDDDAEYRAVETALRDRLTPETLVSLTTQGQALSLAEAIVLAESR